MELFPGRCESGAGDAGAKREKARPRSGRETGRGHARAGSTQEPLPGDEYKAGFVAACPD